MTRKAVKTRDGRSAGAFAIVGDPAEPETWWLLHHTRATPGTPANRRDMELPVDWGLLASAVAALSPRLRGERRVATDPGTIIAAARHLASHYREAGKPLPDILAALL